MENTITVINDTKNLMFKAEIEGQTAHVDYRHYRNNILFVHTYVHEEFRGNGVASMIAEAALDLARTTNKKVVLLCPFMAKYVSEHPEYNDLIAPQ